MPQGIIFREFFCYTKFTCLKMIDNRQASIIIYSYKSVKPRYELDGPGIESRWGRDFPTRPDRPWGPPSLQYNGYRVFPGG